jgi:homoprotocatechuate degradation regulator HpaR
MPAERSLREFSKSLPMSLMRAREAVMGEFRPILNDHGLSEQQWRVLRALAAESGGLEVGELAERTFLLGPSLSRIIANVRERGLITREPVEHDGRRSVIQMSPAGMKVFSEIAPESEARYSEIEANFGAEELNQLQDLLEALVSACESAKTRS